MSLHISMKGTLTVCALPVSFVDEWIMPSDIVRNPTGLNEAFMARGCVECCSRLLIAIQNARRRYDA